MARTERVFKVLMVGEPRVGKTAFVARYCTREWLPNYKATIGGIVKVVAAMTALDLQC